MTSIWEQFNIVAKLEDLEFNPYRRSTMSDGYGHSVLLQVTSAKATIVLYFTSPQKPVPEYILAWAAAEALLVSQVTTVEEWMARTRTPDRGDARITFSFAVMQAKQLEMLLGAKQYKVLLETVGAAQLATMAAGKPAQSPPAARGATGVATRRGRPPKAAVARQAAASAPTAGTPAARTAATVPLERFVSVKPVVAKPSPPPAPGAIHDQPAAGQIPPARPSDDAIRVRDLPVPLNPGSPPASGPDYGLF
jgi:hypothetical protein